MGVATGEITILGTLYIKKYMKCISITDPFRVKEKELHSFIEPYDERTNETLNVASRPKSNLPYGCFVPIFT